MRDLKPCTCQPRGSCAVIGRPRCVRGEVHVRPNAPQWQFLCGEAVHLGRSMEPQRPAQWYLVWCEGLPPSNWERFDYPELTKCQKCDDLLTLEALKHG